MCNGCDCEKEYNDSVNEWGIDTIKLGDVHKPMLERRRVLLETMAKAAIQLYGIENCVLVESQDYDGKGNIVYSWSFKRKEPTDIRVQNGKIERIGSKEKYPLV